MYYSVVKREQFLLDDSSWPLFEGLLVLKKLGDQVKRVVFPSELDLSRKSIPHSECLVMPSQQRTETVLHSEHGSVCEKRVMHLRTTD